MYLATLNLFVFIASAQAALVCGTIGTHDPNKLTVYMGNFFYRGPSTFLMCGLYCRKDAPKCKSFRYSYWPDAAGQYCEFFQDGLHCGDGNVTADSSQPYYYYDIGCALPQYGDIQTTTTTVSTTQTVTSVSTSTYSTERTSTTTILAAPQTTTQITTQIATSYITRNASTSTLYVSVTATISAAAQVTTSYITIRPPTPSPSTIYVTVTYTFQVSAVRVQDTEPSTPAVSILTQTSFQDRTITRTTTSTLTRSSVVTSISTVTRTSSAQRTTVSTTLTVTQTQRTCPASSSSTRRPSTTSSSRRTISSSSTRRPASSGAPRPFAIEDVSMFVAQPTSAAAAETFKGWWERVFGLHA